jgi:circadian clock protein KaiC
MLQSVDVAEFSPGEFTAMLQRQVEEEGVRMVVIDTLSGYANAMPDDKYMTIQLRELLTYLAHHGVTTFLTVEQYGIFGAHGAQSVSYLADSVLLLRYFEYRGEIRRAISVVKRRQGRHENTIRELTFCAEGIVIGKPLSDMHGVLTGVPTLDL